jgi:hypothetical protein
MILLPFDAIFWYGNIKETGAGTVDMLYKIGTVLDLAMIFTPAAALVGFGDPWLWLSQSCAGHAAWTVPGNKTELSPYWQPRDPPQWIDLLGSGERNGPLEGVHNDCQKLKIFWSFVVANL